jgi:hypothetical protein
MFGLDGWLIAGPGGCQSGWSFAHTVVAVAVLGSVGWVVGKIRGEDDD